MIQSITRKFLVKYLPNLADIKKEVYERYYLYIGGPTVVRVQKIDDKYELERKVNESDLVRQGETIQITQEEFDGLKTLAKQKIIRDSYLIQENPKIVIRIYQGDYAGLKRIEVNFKNVEESKNFTPLDWFGKEITNSALAQDGRLLRLKKEEFQELLG